LCSKTSGHQFRWRHRNRLYRR